jgi:prepilin-type N-terminal cleavage/methylation domain-containing protein
MKIRSVLSRVSSEGFTLIELLLVVAIIGIMATVLMTVIDPIDKIRLTNDTGVISTISQLGRASDAYGAGHSNSYVGGTFANAVDDLNTAGEIKYTSTTLKAPAGYAFNYLTTPAGCSTAASSCTGYVYYVELFSKKYKAANAHYYYIYATGKGCFSTTAPPDGTYTCL